MARKRKPQDPNAWQPSYTTYKDGLPADRSVQPSIPVVNYTPEAASAPAEAFQRPVANGGTGATGVRGANAITQFVQQERYARDGYISSADFVPESDRITPGVVSPAERDQFGSTGVERQNQVDANRGYELGLMPATGGMRGTAEQTPGEKQWPAGPSAITKADARQLLPISMVQDFEGRQDFVVSNYPTLAKAATVAGLSSPEVRDVVNLTLAVDAALTIGRTFDPRRQMELLRSMPKPQAALVIDVMNAITAEQQRRTPQIDSQLEVAGLNGSVDLARRALEASTSNAQQNPVLAGIEKWFWNPSINVSGLAFIYPDTDWGPIQDGELYVGAKGGLDALLSANEMSVRAVNTAVFSPGQPGQTFNDAWNATEAGSFDPVTMKAIRENNDPLTVDVMLDFKKFAIQYGPADAWGYLYEKYGSNPDAAAIMDQIMLNTDPDSSLSKLSNEIDAAETSNIGNMMTWFGVGFAGMDRYNYPDIESKANNRLISGATTALSVASTFVFDPTLGASKASTGYKIARYGLARMAPGSIDKVFKTAAVRNHFDYLGKNFDEIRNMEDVGRQAQRLETLASQNRKWYDYNAVRTMYDAGIRGADDAKLFFQDGGNVETLLSGQAMKRGREWTVPHMTKANVIWKATTLRLRGMNPANMGGSAKYIDSVFGEGTSSMLPEDAAKHISDIIEENPQAAGRVLSDFVYEDDGGVARTLLGRVVGVNTEKQTMRNRYGWRRKGLLTGDFGWFADRLGRQMARMPDASRGVEVTTGKDAGTIKQVAQSLGMSRYFSNYLKYIWTDLDEPARIRLVNGLNATAITASGVDLVSPQLARELNAAFAIASRPTTQYAADQVDVLAIRTQAEKAVAAMDRDRKAQNLAAFTAGERAGKVDEEMRRIIEESTDLEQAAKDAAEILDSHDMLRKQYDAYVKQQIADYEAQIPKVVEVDGQQIVKLSRDQQRSIKDLASKRLDEETTLLETAENGLIRGESDSMWEWSTAASEYFSKYGVVPLRWAKNMLASRGPLGEGKTEQFWLWLNHGVIDGADERMISSAQTQAGVGELENMAGTLRQLVPDLQTARPRRSPAASSDELTVIMNPDTPLDTVREMVKGKSFSAAQAKALRARGVKATVLRGANANQQLFVPVNWAMPLSEHGTGVRLQRHIDDLTAEYRDDALENFDSLKAGLQALKNDLSSEYPEFDRIRSEMAARVAALTKASKSIEGMTGPERSRAFGDAFEREFRAALDNGDISNPSSLNATDNYALYDTQLTRRVSIFDAQKMGQIMARQSYLNMLLGTGPSITTVTDLWTLATLAGPRFVMRSGLEDFGLYALTGGKLFGHGGWLDSRKAGSAIREATARGESQQLIRGGNPGMKLGLFETGRREIGTMLARKIPVMRGLILPYLNADEVAQATARAAARGPEKSRTELANLFATAFMRARFFSVNRLRYARGEEMALEGARKEAGDIIKDGVERGYLPSAMARSSEVTEHLADGSASALHKAAAQTEQVEGVTFTHMKAGIDVRNIKSGFGTTFETGRRRHEDIENFYMELDRSLYQSGYKSYLAIAQSQRYYYLRTKLLTAKSDEAIVNAQIALEDFIADFAGQIADDPNLSRYVLVKELGEEEYAKRLLDDALRMMTTRTGKFNAQMLERLRLPNHRRLRVTEDLAQRLGLEYRPTRSGFVMVTLRQDDWDKAVKIAGELDLPTLEAAGRPIRIYGERGVETPRKFGLYYYDEAGKFHYNMQVNDLHDPNLPMPQSIGTADEIQVLVSDKLPFTSGAWSRMGRALARMTREPIYLSNYVDAYTAIRPFRDGMVNRLVAGGKPKDEAAEMAADWAAKWSADKAYDMTMAGVDNPAIRSQLAWQVRNVARFYRALEDFNRRMMRVASNKPETFWKLALGWNVLDDSGFVWEDEYGDRYLMFPGTQAAFQGMNWIMSDVLHVQPKVPGLPMTWGAKVTMFSPSTDPNAMVPTLGAPMSALGLKGLLRVMPSLEWVSKETSQALEGALFGEYSPQQTLAAALMSDTLGPNAKRVFDAFTAVYGGESSRLAMTDTAVAVAGKQAIHAMAAAGLYDPAKDYTPEEITKLKAIADTTAVNAIFLKMLMTPNLPASPQNMSTEVSDEARAIGIDSGDALWIKYLNKFPSYEDAFLAFTKDNPGKAIFTVSKYESTDFYESTVEAQDFIDKNRAEFEARPTGLSHFSPVDGTYAGLTGFYFARANGLKVPTTVEDYFNRTIRSAGQAEMRYLEVEADALIASGEDPAKVAKAKAAARDDVRAKYPYAEYEMAFSQDRKIASNRDADEIAATARYIIDSGQDTDGRAKTYLQVYSEFKTTQRLKADTEKGSSERKRVNAAWSAYVAKEALALRPADDDRYVRFLKIMSAALDVQVEALDGR